MIDFLRGKKTFILVALALVVLGLKLAGIVDDATANTILTALGLGSLATLRLAVRDLE